MIREQDLEAKYTDDEYEEHIESFNVDMDNTDERFRDWLKENVADLKRIYCRRVMEDDEMTSMLAIIPWARQMFIAWDYNQKKEQRIEQEMKEMMGEV